MEKMYGNNGEELVNMCRKVKSLGAVTSLDMTMPDPDSPAGNLDWNELLANVLPHVDIFVPSIEEAMFMMNPYRHGAIRTETEGGDFMDGVPEGTFDELAQRILDWDTSIVLLKAGHKGLYLRTGNVDHLAAETLSLRADAWADREIRVPALRADPSRIKNACAAGDCAVAALLTGMLTGEDAETSARLAAAAGRDNLYGIDGTSGLRTWEAMLAELQ